MPNMFSRRRGSSATPPVNRSTSAAAASAASQAFLTKASSTAALSSAAAAAALRSHNTTPENVGNITTKRMARRGSVSSVGSGSVMGGSVRGGVGRGGLQRNNSSGSMTERTFRTPSPSPGPARDNDARPASRDAPPMPPLPQSLRNGPPRRPTSTEPPERVTSPTPERGGRSSSLDSRSSITSSAAPPRRAKRLSGVPELDTEDSSAKPLNFSRPRSSPNSSPTSPIPFAQRLANGSGSWFAGPVGSMASSSSSPRRPQSVDGAKSIKQPATATTSARPAMARPGNAKPLAIGTPIEPSSRAQQQGAQELEYYSVYDPNSRTFVEASRPKPLAEPASPVVTQFANLPPGSYDPATRSIVPSAKPNLGRTESSEGIMSDSETVPSLSKRNRASVEPPPRNPARPSPDNSPRTPRTPGALQKHPSIVREDPDAERNAEAATPSTGRRPDSRAGYSNAGPSKTYQASPSTHQRSTSLDIPNRQGRGGSLSPSRNARFSAAALVTEGAKHEPHRGISPVKSALKHSPSSSLRTASPVATFSPSPAAIQGPGSDISDTTSLTSADGSTTNNKKKKSVRVSFGEPQEVDAGNAVSTEPKTLIAAIGSEKIRGPDFDDEDESDEIMKPRPALPSFGSVKRNRVQNEVAEKVTERPPDRDGSSSDHVIGGILAAKSSAIDENRPLPPDVTSKDVAEHASDASDDERAVASSHLLEPRDSLQKSAVESHTANVTADEGAKDEEVPAISLQPPTPGIEDEKKVLATESSHHNTSEPLESTNEPIIPSSNGANTTKSDTRDGETRSSVISNISSNESDEGEAFSDAAEDLENEGGGFASLDAIVERPVALKSTTATAPGQALTTSEGEKQADADPEADVLQEGSSDWTEATAYWSKLSKQQRDQIEREHFSSDDEARPSPAAVKRAKQKSPTTKTPTITSTSPPVVSANQPVKPVQSAQTSAPSLKKSLRDQPPSADGGTQMRRTMRDSPASARPVSEHVPARTTLRDGNNRPLSMGQMNASTSARNNATPVNPQRVSQSGPFPSLSTQRNNTQPPTPYSKTASKVTNDSDSESSFKKKRRPSTSTMDSQGRYSMKRSMRAGSIDSERRPISPSPAGPPKKSSLMRSLSPTGVFARAKFDESRNAPRPSSANPSSGVRTLRGANNTRESGRGSTTSSRPSSAITSRFKSRFVDSDSEDEGDRAVSRPVFRSRFVDSDEENDSTIPEELTPVRGIPRRKGQEDGDSTDLDDDSDGGKGAKSGKKSKKRAGIVADPAEIEKAMEAARLKLGIPQTEDVRPSGIENKEGEALQKGSLRANPTDDVQQSQSPAADSAKPEKKRRGLMNSILRRNRNSTMSVEQVGSPAPASPAPASPSTPQAAPPQKETPDGTPSSPSAAKLVRRASNQPRLVRESSYLSTATAPAAHGRSSMADRGSENWPLPPPIPQSILSTDSPRPTTSDGAMRFSMSTMRPQGGRSFSHRVGFTDDVVDSPNGKDAQKETEGVYSQRTGRKKRFGRLRKAFGLYD